MKLSLLLCFPFFAQFLFAQTFTEILPVTPFAGVQYNDIAFADVDGDNDLDALVIGRDRFEVKTSILYINNGLGTYTLKQGTPFVGVDLGSIAIADIDGDNDQDVLITGIDNSNMFNSKLYTNDGNGNFTGLQSLPVGGGVLGSAAFADIDGDNDQDVLITYKINNAVAHAKLYTNDGMGNFAAAGAPFQGAVEGDIAFADVDGDNDQDLLITGYKSFATSFSGLFINDGKGVFTEKPSTPFEQVRHSAVAFADVDGDNDQDVLMTGRNSNGTRTSKLYINNGLGTFTLRSGTPFVAVTQGSIAFADVDGDNDQDVLVTGQYRAGGLIAKLYINDGLGVFTEQVGTPFIGVESSSIAFADVDGDNDQDVLIIGENRFDALSSELFMNDGLGNFNKKTTWFENVSASAIAFSDVDRDNDSDVIITGINRDGKRIAKLYTHDGRFSGDGMDTYSQQLESPFEGVSSGAIAFADVNGDENPDVLITGEDSANVPITKLYTSNWDGLFSERFGNSFNGVSRSSIAFADVDGDNDQDVLLTGDNGTLPIAKLYTNDGGGTFAEVVGTPFRGVYEGATSFADVDGDNDEDVVITGLSKDSIPNAKLYINDGMGTFTEKTNVPFEAVWKSAIAFADVEGDGDQDILITGEDSLGIPISKLYINNGMGIFTEKVSAPFAGVKSGSIAFADIDGGNSDPEVLITGEDSSGTAIAKLYINDGRGNFTELLGTPFEGVRKGSVAFAHVDYDWDLDVLITGEDNSGEPISKLYSNGKIATSLPEIALAQEPLLRLYPNPTSDGHVTLEFVSPQANSIHISMMDTQGRILFQEDRLVTLGQNRIQVDYGQLPSGVYLLRVDDGQHTSTVKMLVE